MGERTDENGMTVACESELDPTIGMMLTAEIERLRAENKRLRAIIRRGLRELDVPAFYGPGSVWNDMLEAADG